MKHEAGFSTPTIPLPTAADFARAKQGYQAGDGVDHIVVRQWLRTWGEPGHVPFEEWLAAQNG
ncbi:hypothetical protein SR41_09545 [Sphingomonas melonis]|uniref:Uncharacterized protein n=1 Tax=Sphingomonas melonis TaxID=152682 RepID=A0A0D1KUK2_9SPHN|nr:hypothetical protein [Sphingomonas melonis]KIU28049.1 hypothetical protein SR41_09545 [Sphingomonas melonis]